MRKNKKVLNAAILIIAIIYVIIIFWYGFRPTSIKAKCEDRCLHEFNPPLTQEQIPLKEECYKFCLTSYGIK